MDNKLELLLKRINIDSDKYIYFNGGKLIKIVGNKEKTSYKFYIDLITNLPYDLYITLTNNLKKTYSEFKEISVIINVEKIENNTII